MEYRVLQCAVEVNKYRPYIALIISCLDVDIDLFYYYYLFFILLMKINI